MEYGIKYYKAQLDEETYILIPIGIIEGYSLKNQFFSNKIYTIPLSEEDLKENRVFSFPDGSFLFHRDLQSKKQILRQYYFYPL